MQRNQEATRDIVYSGLIAAAYVVLTLLLAPISFGPLQIRVSGLLVPVVLLNKRYALGLAIGVALANILSPFGWYDWLIMPVISCASYILAWKMRHDPILALFLSAILVSIGVVIFPLYLGGGIPFWPPASIFFILIPQVTLYIAGWLIIWRNLQDRI